MTNKNAKVVKSFNENGKFICFERKRNNLTVEVEVFVADADKDFIHVRINIIEPDFDFTYKEYGADGTKDSDLAVWKSADDTRKELKQDLNFLMYKSGIDYLEELAIIGIN